jgi:hypothetical protein
LSDESFAPPSPAEKAPVQAEAEAVGRSAAAQSEELVQMLTGQPGKRNGQQTQRDELLEIMEGRGAELAASEPVQAEGATADAGTIKSAAAAGFSGASTSLPHQDKIEQSLGVDLSHVKAYVGGPAEQANKSMGASAYASGDKVAFKAAPDLHTAAHEAAHVIQQAAGVSLQGGVGKAGDQYEQHADAVADRVVSGASAIDLVGSGDSGGSGVQLEASSGESAVQRLGHGGKITSLIAGGFREVTKAGIKAVKFVWKKAKDKAELWALDRRLKKVTDTQDPIKISEALEELAGKYVQETDEGKRAALLSRIKALMPKLEDAMSEARGDKVPLVEARTQFEAKLGEHVRAGSPGNFSLAAPAVQGMCDKAVEILAEFFDQFRDDAESADEFLTRLVNSHPAFQAEIKKIGIDPKTGFAGAVGKQVDDIVKVLKTGGSITDKIVHLNNFMRSVLTPILAGKAPGWETTAGTIFLNIQGNEEKIRFWERLVAAQEADYGQEKVLFSEYEINEEYHKAKKGPEGDMDKKFPFVPVEALEFEQLVWLAAHVGVPINKNRETKDSIVQKLKNAGWKFSGDVKEAKYFAEERPKKGGDAVTSVLLGPGLNYIQGICDNMVDPNHSWIQTAKDLKMPLKAGISGTTHRVMSLNKAIAGAKPAEVRLALLGHLQEIQAHSFHEIMIAANGHDGCEYQPGNYVPFAPITPEEMEKVAGDFLKSGFFALKLGSHDLSVQIHRLLYKA